jgi:hypothetical protein
MKTYIEVRRWDDTVVHRVDVTGKSERNIDRIENGMAINLDHSEYYLEVKEYDNEQPLKP